MPALKGNEMPVLGLAVRARAFYAPIGLHETVSCPDCGQRADRLFGDHGGDCLTAAAVAPPKSALGIIRRHALVSGRFSANEIRPSFDAAGVPGPSRGPAFAAAEKRKWIERDGDERSTDPGTKRHRVSVYRSLIYKPRTAVAAARAPRDERSNP